MNSSVSPALDILYDGGALGEPLRAILEQVAQVVETHTIQRNITDWPFAYFWSDPSEPRHSKLLRYFINPDEKHGCGSFLLGKFVEVFVNALPVGHTFPVILGRHNDFWRVCRVDAETRRGDDQSGQMDVFITRDSDRERFAIIIENKIKRAPNQRDQLQRYVKKAKGRSAKFKEKEIFVFFLPLIDDCWPSEVDVAAIDKQGVRYAYVTFEKHIQRWLDTALETNWPDGSSPEIREHLSYYRNYVEYLVNQRKQRAMSDKVLERLKRAADDAKAGNSKLPSWDEVQLLETSLWEMKPHFQRMLRGNLLLRIEAILRDKKVTPEWYLADNGIATSCQIDSELDERFDRGASLCIRLSDAVQMVRIGITTWLDEVPVFSMGCLRIRFDQESNELESRVLDLASEWFGTARDYYKLNPWIKFGYRYCEEITYGNCHLEGAASNLADGLLRMRDYLVERL